jgi:hypothetical protein
VNVVATRVELNTKGDSERVTNLEARFHLHAAREGDRYALTFSNLTMTFNGKPVVEAAQPGMIGPVTGLVLSYDIAANGDFIALRDFDKLQSFTEGRYMEQNTRAPLSEQPSVKEAQQAMKSGSSREVLQNDASRTWGALVGMWAGLTMSEGQPLFSDSPVNVAVINLPVTFHANFVLIRHEACGKDDRKLGCVRLRAESRPDPAQLAAALDSLKRSAGYAEALTTQGSMKVEDRFELLTDPDTLKPRWAEWIRGADVSGSEDGRDRIQGRQSTKTTMTFDYSKSR